MTPTLRALLCLGEMGRGRGALVMQDPRTQEAHGEEGAAQGSGLISHRDSLPGLSVGLRTPVQAGESPQVSQVLLLTGDKDHPLGSRRKDLSDRWVASGIESRGSGVGMSCDPASDSFQGTSQSPPSGLSQAL